MKSEYVNGVYVEDDGLVKHRVQLSNGEAIVLTEAPDAIRIDWVPSPSLRKGVEDQLPERVYLCDLEAGGIVVHASEGNAFRDYMIPGGMPDDDDDEEAEGVKVPTWKELCALEPALLELEKFAHDCAADTSPQNDLRWYAEIKPRLVKLIGWERPIPGFTASPIQEDEFGLINAAQMVPLPELIKLRSIAAEAIPATHKILYSEAAYDVAYQHLLDVFERWV